VRMAHARPFVLIAATQRTGSTLLAEMLTDLEHAFVFREPRLFLGRVHLKAADLERLRAATGLDLAGAAVVDRDPADAARRFRDRVAGPLLERIEQVGIKEIRYRPDWPRVLEELRRLGDLRVVALARDPRDVYLSLAHLSRERRIRPPGPLRPDRMAADLDREFSIQREIIRATDALTVRYEDLATDPSVVARVRAYVESPVTGPGIIGELKPRNRAVHGRDVTALRMRRWTHEADADLLGDAHEATRRLGEYCDFWGYAQA
jgi:Sulfotransferase family